MQLAAYVEFGDPLVRATYFLEADSFLAPFVTRTLASTLAACEAFQAGEHPHVSRVAKQLREEDPTCPCSEADMINYAVATTTEALQKIQAMLAFEGKAARFRECHAVFKACELLIPELVLAQSPDVTIGRCPELLLIPGVDQGTIDGCIIELGHYRECAGKRAASEALLAVDMALPGKCCE